MINKDVIITKTVDFINKKLTEMSYNDPFIFLARPTIARTINNNIPKLDSFLKLVQDKDGMIDIEGIIDETLDNLIVTKLQKYPNMLGGVSIGEGSVKINIPIMNKTLVFDSNDIEEFKQNLIIK